MKIAAGRVDAFVRSPDPAVCAILVYGPDSGLVRERVESLAKTVLSDLRDPFRVAELTASRLKEVPSLLADEAAAMALTGGRRVVFARDAGDGMTSAFKSLLDQGKGDALVIAEAGELPAKSSLRKLFEGHDKGAALACYADEGAALESFIRATLKEHGLNADADAVAFLTEHMGADRRLSRSELTKLALYMGGPGPVRLEDVIACIGDSATLSLDEVAFCTADGNHAVAQTTLDRLLAEGSQPISILRGVARHFTRLHLAQSHITQGSSPDQAMAALKPPIFFKLSDRFRRQLSRWTPDKLSMALEILIEAELDCKTTGLPAAEITSRALLKLAQAANRGVARPASR